MELGGGAGGIQYRGEGVREYEIDEKRGGSEAWMVRREEGKLVFVVGTPGYRGISIGVCWKQGAGGLHTPWVNDLK